MVPKRRGEGRAPAPESNSERPPVPTQKYLPSHLLQLFHCCRLAALGSPSAHHHYGASPAGLPSSSVTLVGVFLTYASEARTPPWPVDLAAPPRLLAPSPPPSPVDPSAPQGSLIPPAPPWSGVALPLPLDSSPLAAPHRSVPPALLGSFLPPAPPWFSVAPATPWISGSSPWSPEPSAPPCLPPPPPSSRHPPGSLALHLRLLFHLFHRHWSASSSMAPPTVSSTVGHCYGCGLGLVVLLLLWVPPVSSLLRRPPGFCLPASSWISVHLPSSHPRLPLLLLRCKDAPSRRGCYVRVMDLCVFAPWDPVSVSR